MGWLKIQKLEYLGIEKNYYPVSQITHFEKLSFCINLYEIDKGETCAAISRKQEIWRQKFSGRLTNLRFMMK